MKINIKKLDASAVTPGRGSESAAGYDLHAVTPAGNACVIEPHTTCKVHTGIAVAIPDGFFGAIFARSGLATKNGLRPANCVGVIDADYRGEIIVALHNDTDSKQTVVNGARVAQLVILPYMQIEFCEVYELDDTDRGEGGFGSTDTEQLPGQTKLF